VIHHPAFPGGFAPTIHNLRPPVATLALALQLQASANYLHELADRYRSDQCPMAADVTEQAAEADELEADRVMARLIPEPELYDHCDWYGCTGRGVGTVEGRHYCRTHQEPAWNHELALRAAGRVK